MQSLFTQLPEVEISHVEGYIHVLKQYNAIVPYDSSLQHFALQEYCSGAGTLKASSCIDTGDIKLC